MAMDLNAKAAYIRGMMKGMEFDPTTQEGKIIVAMMDLLEEMADVVSEHDDALDQAFDELDAIDEDMDDLVDNIFGDDDEDEDEARMTTAHLKPAMKSPAPTAVPSTLWMKTP